MGEREGGTLAVPCHRERQRATVSSCKAGLNYSRRISAQGAETRCPVVAVYFMRASGDAGLSALKISCELISLQGYLFISILQANFFFKV